MSKFDAYEVGQGVMSVGAFLAAGVAFPFTLAGWGVLPSLSIIPASLWLQVAVWFWVALAVLLVAKALLNWSEFGWYNRQEIAKKLYRLADAVARR